MAVFIFQDRRFQPLTHSSVFNSNVFCELDSVFILYFPNKTRRICSGPSSYNIGPLLGREGVAQNISSGRDDFFESPVGNAHRDSQNVNLIRLVLESAVQ
jgi:hypothetical protein